MMRPRLGCFGLLLLAALPGCSPREHQEVDYSAIFVADRLPVWELSVTSDDWRQLLLAPTEYVPASVTIDGDQYDVGLRLLGNVNSTKKTMRISFDFADPKGDLHGAETLNLRSGAGDPSLLREAVALELFAASGVPAPKHSFVWLTGFSGGAGGVYTLVEEVDRRFLRSRFQEDSGALFKVETGGSLTYLSDSKDSYDRQVYELKSGDPESAYQRLADFIRVLNKTPIVELEAALASTLDLDGFLRALALNTWLSNLDAYPGTAGNFYLYADASGRFHYIPWDLNKAFGNYHGDPCNLSTDELLALDPDQPNCVSGRPLVERLLESPSIRERYHAQLQQLVDGGLQPSSVITTMHALHELIQERAHEDSLKEFSDADFDASLTADITPGTQAKRVPALESFVKRRDELCREVLAKP